MGSNLQNRPVVKLKYLEQCIKIADDKYITCNNGRIQTIFKSEEGFYMLDFDLGLVYVEIIF